ncbi:hypothetical protein [Pseudomonas peradeniyensis]|uniref:DUF6242 domain-containing protein n=1 Tax=Pseudomonas peradeniyensis TaxID=2745488 RepID=A0ABT2V544_9PSED|nr:hypothetical protein [Pseudomonas peradeniyensis]MCU7236811.1 hypothetical protein [Pseudomonas peradeniyensis]
MDNANSASQTLQDLWTQVEPVENTGMLRRVVFAQGKFYAAGGNGLPTTTQVVTGDATGTAWTKLKGAVTSDSGKVLNELYWNGLGTTLQGLSQSGNVVHGSIARPLNAWTDLTAAARAYVDLHGIVYYQPIYGDIATWILVGSNGKVFSRYEDWSGTVERTTTFTSSETVHCVNVIGVFVLIAGSNGKLLSAVKMPTGNPQSFATRTSTFGTSTILSMKLCNGKMFIVGADGKMAYSSDGLTWTAVEDTSFGGTIIRDIAYGNGKYVAVGDGGKTAVSEDGIGWVQQANTFAGTDIRSVAYGNGNFVAVGAAGKIAYWTP